MPEEDFHLSDHVRSQAHGAGLQAGDMFGRGFGPADEWTSYRHGPWRRQAPSSLALGESVQASGILHLAGLVR
ncbi:MAG: hypothetical protein HYV63_11895 [Candidatus Schekmanbacteria bacterium]|nr:hypothetical protein [Candidatus Schekmanbacteria bacterium]